ncbi:MaoC/PaaZ C-terminal domain-containing protein [bacterium]
MALDFDKIQIGDEMPDAKNQVGKYLPIYYAGASGDFNPIHIDPEFGKMVGLGGNILQGLCTMGFMARACTDWADDPGALKRLKVRFAKPVKPLDTVVVHGKVTEKSDDTIVCEMVADVEKTGEVVISNTVAEFRKD